MKEIWYVNMELIWLKDVEIIFLNFLQALFDKKTVMGEIQASKQGSVCPNMPKSVPKLKHDENLHKVLLNYYKFFQEAYSGIEN